MKLLVCIVFVLGILAAPSLAGVMGGIFNDPKNPGKCTITANLVLSAGDIVKDPNTDCGRIICGRGGEAQFHTCGVGMRRGCTQGDYINKSLPYPDCCERQWVCN